MLRRSKREPGETKDVAIKADEAHERLATYDTSRYWVRRPHVLHSQRTPFSSRLAIGCHFARSLEVGTNQISAPAAVEDSG